MITETKFIVRYAETDQMGVVHHSVYPIWFEAARTDLLLKAGLSYSQMEADGLMLPLAELRCRYKSPARYEDEVVVEAAISKLTYVRVFFDYKVYRAADRRLLAEGCTVHACTDKTLRPVNAAKAFPELYDAVKKLIEKD